jgi:DNA-binding transcriptional ArsR family regulator
LRATHHHIFAQSHCHVLHKYTKHFNNLCRNEHESREMPLPVLDDTLDPVEMDRMLENATAAANFLKAISHEGRLLILCHLVSGEKSVTELETLLSARQAAVSQQLSRLRTEGLVTTRRDGKAIYYSLADDRPRKILEVVYDLFCAPAEEGAKP